MSSAPSMNCSAITSGRSSRRARSASSRSRGALHLGHAERRALVRRLDDERQPEPRATAAKSAPRRQQLVARRRQPAACHTSLVRHLSIASAEREHAAAGVGDAEQLERALDRAVLAAAAVQRDEARASKRSRDQRRRARARADRRRARRRPLRAAPRAPSPPLFSDTSRSAELPPSSTATLPKLVDVARRLSPTMPALRRIRGPTPASVDPAHCRTVCRASSISPSMSAALRCALGIDDEVGVLLRDRAPPIASSPSGRTPRSGARRGRPAGCGTRCRRSAARAAAWRCGARAAP